MGAMILNWREDGERILKLFSPKVGDKSIVEEKQKELGFKEVETLQIRKPKGFGEGGVLCPIGTARV